MDESKKEKLERLKRENEAIAEDKALDAEIEKQEQIRKSGTFWGKLKKRVKENREKLKEK